MTGILHTVRSADGTTIAYEEFGDGPPLVLLHGSVCDRTYWAPVIPALAERFTVLTVDRRGHGASGDAPAYALDAERDDVAAVVDAVGEAVHLLGHSYGAIAALEAAVLTPNLRTLALYEPPLGIDAFPESFIAEIEALTASGHRDAAVTLFMRDAVGLPPGVLTELQADTAAWRPMVDTVHTLPRELRSVGGFIFDADRYRGITVPTVLLAGSESPPELFRGVELVRKAVGGAPNSFPQLPG